MTSKLPTTTTTRPAIWVTSTAALEVRHLPPPPAPGPGETLVRVAYSGINPADVKLGRLLGIRDTVAGFDYSGTVIRAGAGSKFAVGDRIAGCTPCSIGRSPHFGTHQDHVLAPDAMAWRLADDGSLPLGHAACLAVSARTAADAVFNLLRYPLPADDAVLPSSAAGHDTINQEKEKGNDLPALLVWGAASSLGFMAIQFTRAAGTSHIFATASPAVGRSD
ncbi:putative alcohol dehydrogenase [Diplodia seriata]|uniref:Putative alcohol dehydrogenase n=1 Tax=Diplodia seriata TaxID=420778 RepID=A0A0G2DS29_9PEZI|nr:putative alcohol dehydrogenase [Diplodia seriata]